MSSHLSGVVVPVRVPSMDQIELFNYLLNVIIIWNNIAVCELFVLDGST